MPPYQYIRIFSGFITGQRINKISLAAEAWFWRLMSIANRQGCVPSDLAVIHAQTVGPRTVSVRKVELWVTEMLAAGLIERVGDQFHFIGFEGLQNRRLFSNRRSGVSPAVRRDVLAIGHCLLCGSPEELSVDHVRPLSKGGGNGRANLQCLCLPCNIKKSNKWEGAAN